ncbi:hypothetical protein [Promicromonospora sukumoe]
MADDLSRLPAEVGLRKLTDAQLHVVGWELQQVRGLDLFSTERGLVAIRQRDSEGLLW